jgi:hypothetical protein
MMTSLPCLKLGEELEGRNVGPEARLGGDDNLDDEFCMEEEEEEGVLPAIPKVWRMLA